MLQTSNVSQTTASPNHWNFRHKVSNRVPSSVSIENVQSLSLTMAVAVSKLTS